VPPIPDHGRRRHQGSKIDVPIQTVRIRIPDTAAIQNRLQ
jgi:hypothetical protein